MWKHCCSHKIRRGLYVLLAAGVCLLGLAGCRDEAQVEQLPYIQPQTPPARNDVRASLYFLQQEDGEAFASEVRQMQVPSTQTPEQVVVSELIRGPGSELFAVAPQGVALQSVALVQDTAFVDLVSSEGSDLSRLATFRTACALTLFETFGTSYVVLTVDGALPAQLDNGVEAANRERDALYLMTYYPAKAGQYVVPSVRLTSRGRDLIQSLFDALKDGPASDDVAQVFRADSQAQLGAHRFSDGLVTLSFTLPENEDLSLMSYAALAMTMLQNLPGAQRVQMSVNAERVIDVPGLAADGTFTRNSLRNFEGGLVKLYFLSQNGRTLVPVRRAVSLREAANPLAIVKEMARGPMEEEQETAMSILPPNIAPEDVLSYTQDGSLGVLSLSDAFFEACSGITAEAELLLVYGIVNALTERQDIDQVLFLREGESAQTFDGDIVLAKPLLRNPGLIGPQS